MFKLFFLFHCSSYFNTDVFVRSLHLSVSIRVYLWFFIFMKQDDLSYCGQVVRDHDPDRFLISMMIPAEYREALWALFAFNYEIAKTREVVSETQLGLIRLQRWKERVADIYDGGDVAEHLGLQAVAKAITQYDLPREHFEMLIHAREFDLEDVLPGNIEGLVNYADFTTTPLFKMVVQVIGGDARSDPVQVVAVNNALAGLLRAMPFHAAQRRYYLPEDLMEQAGQRLDHLHEGKLVDGFNDIIQAVADQVVFGVKCENRYLKKTQKLSEMYIKQLKACGYNPFHSRMRIEPPFKAFRLLF